MLKILSFVVLGLLSLIQVALAGDKPELTTQYVGVPGSILTQIRSNSRTQVFQGKVRLELLAASRQKAFEVAMGQGPMIMHKLNLLISSMPPDVVSSVEGREQVQEQSTEMIKAFFKEKGYEMEVVNVLFVEYLVR